MKTTTCCFTFNQETVRDCRTVTVEGHLTQLYLKGFSRVEGHLTQLYLKGFSRVEGHLTQLYLKGFSRVCVNIDRQMYIILT